MDPERKKKIAVRLGAIALLILLITALIFVLMAEDNELVYVFEIVRHGARAPMLTAPAGFSYGFKVTPGQLTSMGMRQRYLLGKYHFNKYKH